MHPYTVVGYYADNDQTFVDHVDSHDAESAADHCRREMDSDLCIVAVFDGHIVPSYCLNKVS